MRVYETKMKRRTEQGIPIYRTSEESGSSRSRKKILGKTTWFKGGNKKGRTSPLSQQGGLRKGNRSVGNGDLKTRSVMFVEYTPGGELAKRLREQLSSMEKLMGFKI